MLGTSSVDRMLLALEETLECALRSRVRFSPAKSYFAMARGVFCGHEVGRDGITVPLTYSRKVQSIPTPQTTKELQRFLGLGALTKPYPNISIIRNVFYFIRILIFE